VDIDRLQQTGEVTRTLDLYSDTDGWVVQKSALHGMRVTPGDTLFEIADYSHLWVMADVYETDLSAVRLGMSASLSMAYLPGRTWRGTVTWIAPTVDEQTRTIKVRVEVDNANGELKPEMFADVQLTAAGASGLLAPDSAFLRSGERTLAFVDLGDGRLEPREVRLGARVGGELQVLSGLAEGERVVTAANFLLDSESSLKAALSAISSAPAAPAAAASPAPGRNHPQR
jgi:Cu(I)/Ag(I) efflux system membrane fusion protein